MRQLQHVRRESRRAGTGVRNIITGQSPGTAPFTIIERRKLRRFPIKLEVRYRALGPEVEPWESGSGRTLDISGESVLFTTAGPLFAGEEIELSIVWPALLEGRCPLTLVAVGPVVRAQDHCAAISIRCWEFRTRRTMEPVMLPAES